MSETKQQWTPGPWRVEEGTTLVWGACTFADDGTIERLGIPVADMCGNPSWSRDPVVDDDTKAANAALIAAAPALYAALAQIVFDWDGEPEDMHDARAALRSARGED